MRASKKVKGAVLLSAGAALVLGAPTVHADTTSSGNDGLLSGVQLLNGVQLNVPVTVGGAGVLGVGDAETETISTNDSSGSGSSNSSSGGGSVSSNDNDGILSGLQAANNLQANVPVTVCGVGALLASGSGDCSTAAANSSSGGSGNVASTGNDGLISGAQAANNAQLNVPVTVCGLGVLGDAECTSEVLAANTSEGGDGDGTVASTDNDGLLGGLQALNNLQANVPVTVCGLAVLGDAGAACTVESTNNKDGDDGEVGGRFRPDKPEVKGESLPKTGAAGLALLPFGAALVAGGIALRRRTGVEA